MGNISSNITFESLRNNWKWKPNHCKILTLAVSLNIAFS